MKKLTKKENDRRVELISGVVSNSLTDKEHAEFIRLQTRFTKWLQTMYPTASDQVFDIEATTTQGLAIAVNPRHGGC